MDDKVLEGFLRQQLSEGMALAEGSDVLELRPENLDLPQEYLAVFHLRSFTRDAAGIGEAHDHLVHFRFPDDYLIRADPFLVLTYLAPPSIFHPNIRPPAICPGHIYPGMSLVELLLQVADIIAYRKRTVSEHDCLNVREVETEEQT
ncbi:MAG: hypothetical protein HYU66_00200 [Armatimonadetes bacterium]|nr:hypothetical protein [Armatimonadota bacterium]